MNSLFKFPRRVRIHGGECGAVARALHHEAKIISLPAVEENVFFTTNERKSMSTKTSLLKRIAQTAVVALVGGLLATVSPVANAASNSSISGSCVARGGYGGVIKVNVNGDNTTGIYAVQTAVTPIAGVAASSLTVDSTVLTTVGDTGTSSTAILLSPDTVTTQMATLTYLIWWDTDRSAGASPNTGDLTANVTCTVAGAPTSFSLSSSSASIAATESATFTVTPKDANSVTTLLNQTDTFTVTSGSGTASSTAKIATGIEMTNATTGARLGTYLVGGNVPTMKAGAVRNTINGANQTSAATGSTVATAATVTLGNTHADGISAGNSDSPNITANADTVTATGAFTVNVTNTAATSTTFTVAGSGLLAGATSATFTLTTQSFIYGTGWGVGSAAAIGAGGSSGGAVAGAGLIDANQTAAYNSPDKTGTAASPAALNGTPATASDTVYVSTAKKAVTLTWQLSAAGTFPVTVEAVSTTSSTPAGITLETLNINSGTDTQTTLTLTATAPVAGQSYKVTWKSAATTSISATFSYIDPVVNATYGSVTLNPASAGKALAASTVTTIATIKDQFNSPVSGAVVLWSQTGRNATLSDVSKTTDSNGESSYAFTDDGLPATTTSEVVSARAGTTGSGGYTASSSVTYTWVTALTAGSLRLTNNGDTTDGNSVDASVTFTATVLDASGLALSGYPVVFTGDDETYFSTTANTVTYWTGTNGQITAVFKGYKAGTGTVTASSGGKSATSDFTIIAGGSRAIAADATAASMAAGSSKRVTATVTDIYGNPVKNATVTVKYVGTAGRVASVNGVTGASSTTDDAGKVIAEIASDATTGVGTGTLTLEITAGNTSTAALTTKGTARPAKVEKATVAVTITAADSSIADAANAATDAAAEAIDAANAATDAANLAAEAADAATVAAEEARDAADAATAAVEELATQVATLMAALKAQITTLANTVAKIAKKVKA